MKSSSEVVDACKKYSSIHHGRNIRQACRLKSFEAQRILTVLDDTIQGLEVIARIPPLCAKLRTVAIELGRDVCLLFGHIGTLLGHHVNADVDPLKTSKPEMEITVSRSYFPPLYKESCYSPLVLQKIRMLVKDLIHLLQDKPHVVEMIMVEVEPSENLSDFILHMKELRSFIYERLHKSDSDEKKQQELLEDIEKREKKYAEDIEKLEKEVEAAKHANDKQLQQLQDDIDELEDDLEKMLTINNEKIFQMKMDARTELEHVEKNSKIRKLFLEEEFQLLTNQYLSLIEEHRESEAILRKRNYKINTEVDNWIQKYDHDMQEKQAFFEIITEDAAAERAELDKKEEEFAILEKEYVMIMKEREILENIRKFQEELLRKQTLAAIAIQSVWRGYKARKAYKKLKKAKDKGKGKKK